MRKIPYPRKKGQNTRGEGERLTRTTLWRSHTTIQSDQIIHDKWITKKFFEFVITKIVASITHQLVANLGEVRPGQSILDHEVL